MATISALADDRFVLALSLTELALLHSLIGRTDSPSSSYYDRLLRRIFEKTCELSEHNLKLQSWIATFDRQTQAGKIRHASTTMRRLTADTPAVPEDTYVLTELSEGQIELECSAEGFQMLWALLDYVNPSEHPSSQLRQEMWFTATQEQRVVLRNLRRREFDDGGINFVK